MQNFDIIGALRTYCTTNNIKFIWQYDEFYANISTTQEYSLDHLIMVVDLKPTPIINGSNVGDITYSGLMMIGKKFDADGLQASLDENQLQKYDRRLFELTSSLVTHAATFACDENLLLTMGQIDYLFNTFDANIDFVAAQAISFEQ